MVNVCREPSIWLSLEVTVYIRSYLPELGDGSVMLDQACLCSLENMAMLLFLGTAVCVQINTSMNHE